MNYSHINILATRYETKQAREALSKTLGFEDSPDFQDWERHFQDAGRIGEFIQLYREGGLDEDQNFLLMDLILASVEEGFLDEEQWHYIEQVLIDDYDLHASTIWKWADIDEETGIPLNGFQISRRMQGLLQKKYEEQLAAGLTTATQVQPDFKKFWDTRFEGHVPVGHMLRKTLEERWIRFHSLPDSKRYPETELDWSMLLARHNQLAEEVLGNASRCWLVVGHELEPAGSEEGGHLARFDFDLWFHWLDDADPGYELERPVYAAEIIWQGGQFNRLIGKIAKWEETGILFVSQETGAVFAPYDGGIDLILPRSEDISALAEKYCEWLPSNEEGL